MHALIRTFVAALLALWLAMPSVGGEGGENGGGTGVWILPRCEFLSGDPLAIGMHGAPKASRSFSSLSQSLSLNGSSECGQIVATLIDPSSGSLVPLSVVGRNATLPSSVLVGLRAAGVTYAQIVMMDAAHQGYVIHVVLDIAAGSVTLNIF